MSKNLLNRIKKLDPLPLAVGTIAALPITGLATLSMANIVDNPLVLSATSILASLSAGVGIAGLYLDPIISEASQEVRNTRSVSAFSGSCLVGVAFCAACLTTDILETKNDHVDVPPNSTSTLKMAP